ncbi:response regulator transcription factor [Oceanirhabdus sp. W0125-5]|uniref:response regulator transcription factor n=1 Tax=Oceanirhabdus sp. W0125-5 TaxID=2999116 RepID=UPI0022F2D462|nr:response regulator transcription factor [Oceanirhabdus sp. W0125-5]WBW97642.1 response regulator transcription factor [Oceanirhabdus sp. W0125-5]
MEKLLVIEDDESLATGIKYTLEKEGFNVKVRNCISDGAKAFEEDNFDLVLLDVMLPDGNGFELCEKIRKKSEIPIIFLTACDEEVNIVLGLDLGADDYITKPFRVRELVSRLRAALRRSNMKKESSEYIDRISSGNLILNLMERKLMKSGKEIFLTTMEYKLIAMFMKSPQKTLSRNVILEKLWDINGEFVDDNTLSVYIRRLREKIEDDPSRPRFIITVRGLGYKWNQGSK